MTKEQVKELGGILQKSSLHQAAKLLGHRGGKRGGPARAAKLSPNERKRIAKMGAQARWKRRPTANS